MTTSHAARYAPALIVPEIATMLLAVKVVAFALILYVLEEFGSTVLNIIHAQADRHRPLFDYSGRATRTRATRPPLAATLIIYGLVLVGAVVLARLTCII